MAAWLLLFSGGSDCTQKQSAPQQGAGMNILNILNEYIASQGSGAAGRDFAASTLTTADPFQHPPDSGLSPPGGWEPSARLSGHPRRTPKGLCERTTVRRWRSKCCTRAAPVPRKSSPPLPLKLNLPVEQDPKPG